MNSTSKIIAVVAVIIVVAAAAFVVLGGDSEKSEGDKNKEALAPVLQKMSDDTADSCTPDDSWKCQLRR